MVSHRIRENLHYTHIHSIVDQYPSRVQRVLRHPYGFRHAPGHIIYLCHVNAAHYSLGKRPCFRIGAFPCRCFGSHLLLQFCIRSCACGGFLFYFRLQLVNVSDVAHLQPPRLLPGVYVAVLSARLVSLVVYAHQLAVAQCLAVRPHGGRVRLHLRLRLVHFPYAQSVRALLHVGYVRQRVGMQSAHLFWADAVRFCLAPQFRGAFL